jgi:hypothetical protein
MTPTHAYQASPIKPTVADVGAPADPLRSAIAEIRRAIAQYPELTDFGFGACFGERRLPSAEREAAFRANRAKMFEERSLLQFLSARAWLQGQGKRQTINRRGTSYGLKHIAAHDIGYVTNGMFICAAISAGFQIERAGAWWGSPNAWLNISTRAWRRRRDGARRR